MLLFPESGPRKNFRVNGLPKLSTLCYAHAAPRQPEQLPDYIHHVRTHRTSSDPAYLHTYVYLYMKREEEECCYFRNPGLKRAFG